MALRGAAVPRLAAVGAGEQRVVDEIDAGVVHASAGVLGQIGVREPGVLYGRLREARSEELRELERLAAVRRGPVVDLVAVAAQEQERRLRGQPVLVDVGRALMARIDDRVVDGIRREDRLATGQTAGVIDELRGGEAEGRGGGEAWREQGRADGEGRHP